MQVAVEKKERNQSIELCRLTAAIAVVFIHVALPDPIGGWINCLCRFAVPFFFMVSGYFSFGRDSVWVKGQLVKVLKLNLYAPMLYYAWKYIEFYRGSGLWAFLGDEVFHQGIFMQWLIQHIGPGAGHLWFLSALVPCYLGLWIYVRFREGEWNTPLYLVGFFLMGVYFILATILPSNGLQIPYEAYRNGWFLGIPLFLLGMFLHEYGKQITEKFCLSAGRLVLLVAIGILLSLLQYRTYGTSEVFLGTIPELIGLLLLLAAHPVLPGNFLKRVTPRLGRISTVIYIIHILVKDMYDTYLFPRAAESLGVLEPWMKPFLVAIISFAGAILWDWLLRSIKIRRPVKA